MAADRAVAARPAGLTSARLTGNRQPRFAAIPGLIYEFFNISRQYFSGAGVLLYLP
jgi:hypothetical protein